MKPLLAPSELLTDAELRDLQVEAQKQVDEEEKAKAKEKYKKDLVAQYRQDRGLAEAREPILIDLPETGNCIRVNNREYSQGHTYTVPTSVAIMLRDTMQRAWEHQAEIEGRSKDWFRRQRLTRMSAMTGATTSGPASHFLKV